MPRARSKGYFKESGFQSGIHKIASIEEVKEVAGKMCGKHFINKYTPSSGVICTSVLVMEEVE